MKEVVSRRHQVVRRLVGVTFVLVVYSALTAAMYRHMARPATGIEPRVEVVQAAQPTQRNIAVRDGWFWVDGERFLIKSVGWDPVRPGELPWERTFRRAELEHDLARIRAAGFNTIRTWAPLGPEELALVARHELRVLQGIWIDPAGSFADPVFRRRALADVARAVQQSRLSPAILGYVVLNEPRAKAVALAGLDQTRAFLREVVASVRALDPSAPIGYASWAGMEALDDPLLDFVAFNVYPHRPRVVMDELGLAGYIKMLGREIARGRPLIISEFGISVSPRGEVQGRGGATESVQATQLVELGALFLASGATGISVFQWSDGWWKNNDASGDEQQHDPADPEEWFGLVAYGGVGDREGRPRPSLAAMTTLQRALLVEPQDGIVASGSVPVRVMTSDPIRLEVSVNAGPRYAIELWSAGRELVEGKLFVPGGGTREQFTFHFLDATGAEIRTERRVLRTAPRAARTLSITPVEQRVAPGAPIVVEIGATGDGAAGLRVSVAMFAEDRYHEDRRQVVLGPDGKTRIELQAPAEQTVIGLVAFEDDPLIPPAERAATWAVAEVRE